MNLTLAEGRKNERARISHDAPTVKLTLQFLNGGTDTRRVRVYDLSKTGMSFVDKNEVPLTAKCVLILYRQRRPLRVIGAVINCRPDKAGGFVVGVKFTSITPV